MADPKPSSQSGGCDKAKEEIKAMGHHDRSPHHHKETHGRNEDIDENTRVDDVKGPGVFQRMKEEIEAIVDAVHPKKGSKSENHDNTT